MAPELERMVRTLDDTRQIVGALNRYALAIDSHRYELFDQVFAPDVHADYIGPSRWTDREGIRRDMKAFHEALDGCLHRITNHQVEVDGDRANSICYVVVRLLRGADDFEMGGFYDDAFVRTRKGWLIANRRFRGSWWRGKPGVIDGPDGFVFEPEILTLRHAADAGEVSFLDALAKNKTTRELT